MKNIYKFLFFSLLTMLAFVACDPQDGDDHSLGAPDTVTADQVSFSYTKDPKSDNVLNLKIADGINVPYSVLWDLGNEETSKDKAVTAEYPFAGTYKISLTVYTADGTAIVKEQEVTFDKDDYTLLQTPKYTSLTGGLDFEGGKTWVFDRTVEGHFGIGPADGDKPGWWSCPPEGKAECSLYNQQFNFSLSKTGGLKLIWTNEGKVYTNEPGRAALAKEGYTKSSVPPAGDFDVEYTPKDSYTFKMSEKAGILTLNGGAFFGHYTGNSTYSIVNLTDDELYLKVVSAVEPGNGWWYRFVPKK